MSRRACYLAGVKTAFPVIFGFISIAIAYAFVALQAGFTSGETILMSALVFAGASQIMAAGMAAQGASVIAIVLATLILNLRHFIMSTCVMDRMRDATPLQRIIAAFGVTDESFALYMTAPQSHQTIYYFWGLLTCTYLSWVGGAVIGCTVRQLLPAIVTNSFGITLYAMFIGLLVPGMKGNTRLTCVIALAALLSAIFSRFADASIAIIASTLLAAGIGVFIADAPQKPGTPQEGDAP